MIGDDKPAMTDVDISMPHTFAPRSPTGKRVFDLCVSITLAIVCLPVFGLTALAVYMALGSPLLFGQERAGLAAKSFRIRKFRTMTDARDSEGNLLPDALRQTATTVFLRRIRVDELPQLLVIIAGDMSFVGPRPLPPEAIRGFGAMGGLRSAVRPGLTGWAQVNGNTLLTPAQKLALDIWYIDHHSFLTDMRIVLMTIRTVVMGEKINIANLKKAQMHLWHREFTRASEPL
jgi:lipopolysaccharide/colanic/teichoic acid biosynthesis glycosyltransferase